jgi:hypothetical protein
MPNEFIIREGFSSKGGTIISGSLTVTSFTGSLVTASNAITSSYSVNSNTASFVQTILSSSYAPTSVSASIASVSYKTINNPPASYAPYGISSSLWTTNFGNNGYISSNIFHTNTSYGPGSNAIRPTYSSSIYLTPVYINKTGQLTRFAVFGGLNLAAQSTGSWRVAVYSNSTVMLPKTKLFEFERNIATPTGSIVRLLYETTSSQGPVLQQGQIYWLATSVEGFVSNVTHMFLVDSPTVLNLPSANRMISPLLGTSMPISQNAIRNICHYKYPLTSTGSALPNELSQSTSFYSVIGYGVDGGNSFGTVHIGPFIKLDY